MKTMLQLVGPMALVSVLLMKVSPLAGLFACIAIFIPLMTMCARTIVRQARPRRSGAGFVIRRIIAVPMLLVDAGLLTFGVFTLFIGPKPESLLGSASLIFVAWFLGYLTWWLLLFPNSRPGVWPDDSGGSKPRPKGPTPHPVHGSPLPTRDVGATVRQGLAARSAYRENFLRT